MLRRFYEGTLATITLTLLVSLAAVVLYAVAARTAGSSPIWYDEVASVMLAWLSFLGAALATLRHAHLNFDTLLVSRPLPLRKVLFFFGEIVFVAVFCLVAWAGWEILAIFGGETLTSLRFVPLSLVQAIVPVSAVLMIISRLLVTPESWRRVIAGQDIDSVEIAAEISRAQNDMSSRAT
ncbi:MAG: TRAP transporter small permease [Burkholderiaceae bacterium]